MSARPAIELTPVTGAGLPASAIYPGLPASFFLALEHHGGHTAAHQAFVQFLGFGQCSTDQHRLPPQHPVMCSFDPVALAAGGESRSARSRMSFVRWHRVDTELVELPGWPPAASQRGSRHSGRTAAYRLIRARAPRDGVEHFPSVSVVSIPSLASTAAGTCPASAAVARIRPRDALIRVHRVVSWTMVHVAL